ncbi:Uma2 family endonuclease [Terriglobus sp.]|uniref:Uma2 family endonuclease n=1 Tax=Terriglobus sp. TaxID=1889013 RepID=UPI003B00F2E1
MATAVHILVEEYLRSSYEPDCDYVDGELQERNLGEQYHSLVQKMVAVIFSVTRKQWGLRSLTEQRVQVSARRYRIPDVCVVRSSDPIEPILHTPPVLCVEVLSPEDRFARIQQRVQEYQQMGVQHIWVIDPETREIWTAAGQEGLRPFTGNALPVPGVSAAISVADIFAEIDEAPRS